MFTLAEYIGNSYQYPAAELTRLFLRHGSAFKTNAACSSAQSEYQCQRSKHANAAFCSEGLYSHPAEGGSSLLMVSLWKTEETTPKFLDAGFVRPNFA